MDRTRRTDAEGLEAIDLLLEQGSADELHALRSAVARDPQRALELAETVAVVEQMRQLRTEASPAFAGRMQAVLLRSDRYQRAHYLPRTATWKRIATTAAAAAVTFFLLSWLDAGRWFCAPKRETAVFGGIDVTASAAPPAPAPPLVTPEEADWKQALLDIRARLELETSEELQAALAAGLDQHDDPLDRWVEPWNSMVLARLDHELRQHPEVRYRALRERGVMAAVDARVQGIADGIADELSARLAENPADVEVAELAFGMRALIGAGTTGRRADALRACGRELVRRLPDLHGALLVTALSGLLEEAAIAGDPLDAVAQHGARLLDEVFGLGQRTWQRGRPDLLGNRVAAATLGEAGRLLQRLPALGIDGRRCAVARQLLLGRLRERRQSGQDRPEVLAAMLYGYAERMPNDEADRIAFTLRRWKPARLAPDYRTVMQMAWGLGPGSVGFARMQRELRQLAIQPVPSGLVERAAFSLCLATNYAGFVGTLLPNARLARDS
ncbi:MAG TPA: hypothetical protein ENI87_06415 [bacterium]|nr:hypothetical protein [bacterium]